MKKKFRGFYLIISSFVIAILHLPFAFAKSASAGAKFLWKTVEDSLPVEPAKAILAEPIMLGKSVYDSLHYQLSGLSKQAFDYAKMGFDKLIADGKLLNDSLIAIADFSQPSSIKRLYVLDIKNYRLLFNSLVAHGKNSGKEMATNFSNQGESYKSSPGFYVTGTTYQGKNGYSLKLEGVEAGINSNAFARGIVVHGADYVSEDLANKQGYIGRSQGCPAVPVRENNHLIELIKNGACFFVYHPSYISRSVLLQ